MVTGGVRGGQVWTIGARTGLGGITGHDLGHISDPGVGTSGAPIGQ